VSSRRLAALVLAALLLASFAGAIYWLSGGFPSGSQGASSDGGYEA